jgi:CheY-like chemotaxis protein
MTSDALREAGLTTRLHHVADGEEALAYLHTVRERPDLVLLDLRLPGVDGHEVLRRMKEDGRLRAIPVVMVSTSDDPDDVDASYDLGASCYVRKPGTIEAYVDVVRSLERFWVGVARLPGARQW